MDAGVRRLAIICSMAVVIIAAVLVFFFAPDSNLNKGSGSAKTMQDKETDDGIFEDKNRVGNDLSGFLQDEGFFDPDGNSVLERAKDQANRLSLLVTSIEKDIRIQIVDSEGTPVKGNRFLVELEGLGEFKDLDQDGIIYIGDLSAGEYYVALRPTEGFVVPKNPTRIRVKDKVEYLAIEDISVLIKTEDEIDASMEDTGTNGAVEDADKTEIKELQTQLAGTRLGIDVSKWNGSIDWDKVKNSGIDYAIIRVGYRGSASGTIVVDPFFEANMTGAAAAKVLTGVYFFTQAVNEVEAVEEASAVLELIKNYKLDYPIYIDTESAGGRADGIDAQTRTLVCDAFCRTIENAGYTAGIYANRHWIGNNLDIARLDRWELWLAEYREVPLYQGYYSMWQYTSKGAVDGIEGNVDLDISYETARKE